MYPRVPAFLRAKSAAYPSKQSDDLTPELADENEMGDGELGNLLAQLIAAAGRIVRSVMSSGSVCAKISNSDRLGYTSGYTGYRTAVCPLRTPCPLNMLAVEVETGASAPLTLKWCLRPIRVPGTPRQRQGEVDTL